MTIRDRWRRSACLASGLALALTGTTLADETTFERLLGAEGEPANWLTHHGDYSAKRFSTLSEINKDTVGDLKVAWTFALGGVEGGGIWPHGGLEGTPIVDNGMMYVTDGWGSVYKLDMTSGTGKLVWKMNPETDKDWAESRRGFMGRSGHLPHGGWTPDLHPSGHRRSDLGA